MADAPKLTVGDFITIEVLAPKDEGDEYTVALSCTPGMPDLTKLGLLYATWTNLADQLPEPEDLEAPDET